MDYPKNLSDKELAGYMRVTDGIYPMSSQHMYAHELKDTYEKLSQERQKTKELDWYRREYNTEHYGNEEGKDMVMWNNFESEPE